MCFVGETVVVKKMVKRNWEKVSETETPVGERLGWLSVVAFDVEGWGLMWRTTLGDRGWSWKVVVSFDGVGSLPPLEMAK